jgi:hypothetical protein
MVSNSGINCWKIEKDQTWTKINDFRTLDKFEAEMGNLKHWKKISLVNGESLTRYYKNAKNYPNVAYIVEPTKEFHNCITKKPHLFENYYTKNPYKEIHDRLPELKGIF